MSLSDRVYASITAVVVSLTTVSAMAAEGGDQLPQLDPTLYPAQLFWLVVFFGFLYLLMRYVALPSVQRTQDTRKETIASEIAAARKSNDDARVVMGQIEQSLAKARGKARVAVDEIKLETANEAAEKLAQQQRGLMRQLHHAESKIATARVAAMKDVESVAKELSAMIVAQVSDMKASGAQ